MMLVEQIGNLRPTGSLIKSWSSFRDEHELYAEQKLPQVESRGNDRMV